MGEINSPYCMSVIKNWKGADVLLQSRWAVLYNKTTAFRRYVVGEDPVISLALELSTISGTQTDYRLNNCNL